MMTSVLMGAGLCEFELHPETPAAIKELMPSKASGTDLWGTHIAFTAQDHLIPETSDTSIASASDCVWCGPVWSRGNKGTRFSGPHMTGWLGNDRGGPGFASFNSHTPTWPATISQVVQAWFPLSGDTNGIRYGTAASAPSTSIAGLDVDTYMPTCKGPLDQLMAMVGCEYHVTHAGRIDWGDPTALYSLNGPSVVCAENVGTDRLYRVLNCTPTDQRPDLGVAVEEDIFGLRNWSKVIGSDGVNGTFMADSTITARTLYAGGFGSFWSETTTVDLTNFLDIVAFATAAAELYGGTNRTITVTCDDYCVPALVSAGNSVYCWSPEDFVEDATVDLELGGRVIHPENLRVVQMSAPFQTGMGAYAITHVSGSTYKTTRITDYIVPEDGTPTVLTLGSRPEPFVLKPPSLMTSRYT